MEANDSGILQLIMDWLRAPGIKIGVIIAITAVILPIGRQIIDRIIRRSISHRNHEGAEAERKREDTVVRVFNGTYTVMVILTAGMMVLSELGVAISPLLAAAGVAGLSFGFGGQYMIRDVIAGAFVIFENQYRVGDIICLDDTCGQVEDISLRMTTLRDLDGVVHHIPNGVPAKISNMSKHFSGINMDIGISYSSDLDHVIKVVNKVGKDLADDKKWKADILEAPQFERVDEFADSAIVIKILGKTIPSMQWAVAGEMRKRLKLAFDKENIEIPFPQRVIHTRK